MAKGESKLGGSGGALKGISVDMQKELERLGDDSVREMFAQSTAIGGAFGGKTISKKEQAEAQKEANRLYGSGHNFIMTSFHAMQDVAEKNGMQNDFTFNEVTGKVTRKTDNGRIEVKADNYAFSSQPGASADRRWIVDTYTGWNISGQKRFSNVEDALAYARKI